MAGRTTARRRKIFPHLNDDEKKTHDASGSANADSGEVNSVASDKAIHNINTPPPKKGSTHASAAKKNITSWKSLDSIHGSTHHLLPLPLVYVVLVCSGLFWITSFRDVMATGKPILDRLGALWGQDDADSLFLVRFPHDDVLGVWLCVIRLPDQPNVTFHALTNMHTSNTPNLQIGSTIPAAGNPNRVAFPPSFP